MILHITPSQVAGKVAVPGSKSHTIRAIAGAKDSVILLEQVRTIDKRRLREHMGRLDENQMAQVNDAIAVSFGLQNGKGT